MQKPRAREVDIFLAGRCTNQQVLIMIKRRLPVFENERVFKLFSALQNRFSQSSLWIDLSERPPDWWRIWNDAELQLSFTEEEEALGRKILYSLGIIISVPDEFPI